MPRDASSETLKLIVHKWSPDSCVKVVFEKASFNSGEKLCGVAMLYPAHVIPKAPIVSASGFDKSHTPLSITGS